MKNKWVHILGGMTLAIMILFHCRQQVDTQ